jgi:hypothetical protein
MVYIAEARTRDPGYQNTPIAEEAWLKDRSAVESG